MGVECWRSEKNRSDPGAGVQAGEGTWQRILRVACHHAVLGSSKACVAQRKTQTHRKVYISLVAQ